MDQAQKTKKKEKPLEERGKIMREGQKSTGCSC